MTRVRATLLVRHARELLTFTEALPSHAPQAPWDPQALGLIVDGAVAVDGDTIVAVGTTHDVERSVDLTDDARVIDATDAVVAPGLVDCHTHALFTGDRADEYSLRVQGRGYREIAASGGGIAVSVRAVRAATADQLSATLGQRLARMRSFGVTTVEVKTGYGLDLATELRCLAAIRANAPCAVPTFLPLHAVPPELRDQRDGRKRYLSAVRSTMLPAVIAAGAAAWVDAYIDGPGFSVDEARPILDDARRAGLGVRLHIGQFDDVGGAELAAELGAASADHLEHVSDAGVRALAAAGVVGVLLPGAAFSLGQAMPDARRLRSLGLAVALATDCNPGTSYTENLPLMAAFAVRQMGLSTVEAWHAITRTAARALRRDDLGRLAPGARADVCVFDLPSWEALPYRYGQALARLTIAEGRVTD